MLSELRGAAVVITPWRDYLSPSGGPSALAECRTRCQPTFAAQRAAIEQIVRKLRPGAVACLGAGPLNDIPFPLLVDSQATIHLVDWMRGSIDFGLARSIIEESAGGGLACIFCRQSGGVPAAYCRSYRRPAQAGAGVCPAYAAVAAAAGGAMCSAYERADLPHVHDRDVSGGYAGAFGEALADGLTGVTSWRQAVRRALSLARRLKQQRGALDIDDRSVDLVISSLVVSQFAFEPYDYFARQVQSLIGPPSAREERQLRPLAETLRAELLANQVAGHCDEIERILAPGGRCFMAFETFHTGDGGHHWFLVRDMHQALAAIAERFAFDFDMVPQYAVQIAYEGTGAHSIVQQFLLLQRHDRAAT